MEDKKQIILHIDQDSLQELLDLLKSKGIGEFQYSRKQSLEGEFPIAMVLIAVMKYAFPVLKDLLLELINKGKIGYIKVGEIELRDVTYKNAMKLFEDLNKNSGDEKPK